MRMHRRYYDLFDFKDYYMRLSCWDPDDPDAKSKYIDNPAAWALCEERVRQAMVDSDTPFVEVKGEAAFYGPKIDIQFKTVGLKEFTVSTCQLDFGVPLRFVEAGIPVVYRDRDGTEKAPYVIHRAPLSTHERFISFLIEHYAGAFPTWLSPVQVRILTVAERHDEYAQRVCQALRTHLIRAEVDSSEEKLSKKIRTGTVEKIPVLLVVGDNEVAEERLMVRRYQVQEQRGFSVTELTEMLRAEIRARVHVRAWSDLDGLS
jgi:threonyl-tRNA synthetase